MLSCCFVERVAHNDVLAVTHSVGGLNESINGGRAFGGTDFGT